MKHCHDCNSSTKYDAEILMFIAVSVKFLVVALWYIVLHLNRLFCLGKCCVSMLLQVFCLHLVETCLLFFFRSYMSDTRPLHSFLSYISLKQPRTREVGREDGKNAAPYSIRTCELRCIDRACIIAHHYLEAKRTCQDVRSYPSFR